MFSQLASWKDTIDVLAALASIAQAIATVIAICIGGFWTYHLFWLKRQRYPRVNLSHSITHRNLTADRILLHVVITVENKGEVLVRFEKGVLWVHHVLPLPTPIVDWLFEGKDILAELRSRIQDEGGYLWQTEIPWPLIEQKTTTWPSGYLEIEPGNSAQIRYDIILDQEVRTIKVYSFLTNVVKKPIPVYGHFAKNWFWFSPESRRPVGWSLATMYDISPIYDHSNK